MRLKGGSVLIVICVASFMNGPFTDKIWLNLFVEMFVDEVEPLVGQNKFDVGQFRHSALIFDETISFTEQGSFHQSDRPVW